MSVKKKPSATILSLNIQLADYWETEEFGPEPTDPIFKAVVYELTRKAMDHPEYSSLRERITKIRQEVIKEQLEPIVREAIETPTARTNRFGETQCEPVTLRSMILDEAKSALTKRQQDGFRDKGTLLEQVIRAEVSSAFARELKESIDKAKADATKAVQEEAAKLLAETIQRMAK